MVPPESLPAGVILTQAELLGRPSRPRPAAPRSREEPAETLYVDDDATDPDAGREVAVAHTYATDTIEDPADGGKVASVGGRKARVAKGVTDHDWLISWELHPPASCGCTQYAIVAGHGMTRDQVLGLAAKAAPGALRPTLPEAALPKGMRSLGTLVGNPYSIGTDVGGTRLTFDVHGVVAQVENYEGDPRLVAHMRFWTHVQPGSTIVVGGDGGQVFLIYLSTRTGGPYTGPPLDLAKLTASLHSATAADVDAAHRRALSRPHDAADVCPYLTDVPPNPDYFAGYLHGIRWVVGLWPRAGGIDGCMSSIESESSGSRGGLTDLPAAGPAGIRISGVTVGGGFRHALGFVVGDAPAAATRVAVTAGELSGDAQVGTTGPVAGRKWFVAVFEVGPFRKRPTSAAAYDASGHEVARTP
jgi:hypothetical protein